jgi:hypothetical protein
MAHSSGLRTKGHAIIQLGLTADGHESSGYSFA